MNVVADHDPNYLHQMTDVDDITDWLDVITEAIDGDEYEPTSREEDFLESISGQLEAWDVSADDDAEQPLTGKQLVSLRGIYDKVKED